MTTHQINKAQIARAGYEYQDLVAIELLLQLYQDPDRYDWAELDSDDVDFRSVDDIVMKYSRHNSYEAVQVKFTVDPDRYKLSVGWLTARDISKPNSTSLIGKWSSRLRQLQASGAGVAARLVTNRPFSDEFNNCVTEDNRIDFANLSEEHQQALREEIGSHEAACHFFENFEFHFQPHIQIDVNSLEDKRREVRSRLVPHYTDDYGWRILNDKVKNWSIHKNEPLPDGRIRFQDLKSVIRKNRPSPLLQNFQVPENYAAPNSAFQDEWHKRVCVGNSSNVLWGLPGQGKSTFLSNYVHRLRKESFFVARHHYFLSLAEYNADRFAYDAIENSIITQIKSFLHEEPEPVEKENSRQLKSYIQAAAEFAKSKSTIFVLIIDGLDHVWREGGSIDQMNHLFMSVTLDHDHYSLVCGTQKIESRLLPPALLKRCPLSNWVSLPPLNLDNVRKLLSPKLANSEIEFDTGYRHDLNGFLKLLASSCSGNPLVLTYILEELSGPHKKWSYDALSKMNPSPSSGVDGYYRNLWNRLPASGKTALMLMATVDFNWPSVSSIGSVVNQHTGGIVGYSIDHLVSQKRTRIVPFHGSLLVWIRNLKEYDTEQDRLFVWVLEWINHQAPEFLKWRWQNILNAKGKGPDFDFGISRDWVLTSLADGYDIDDIIGVLDQACNFSFKHSDYSSAIRYRSMRTRLSNSDYNFHELGSLEAQRKGVHFSNREYWNRLMDNLQFIQDDDVILRMVRYAHLNGLTDDLETIIDELRSRQNEAIEGGIDDWQSYCMAVEPILFADSIRAPRKIAKLKNFLTQKGDTSVFFNTVSQALLLDEDYDSELQISVYLSKKKKIPPDAIAQALVTAATTDADRLPSIPYLENQPYWVLATSLQGQSIEMSAAAIPNPKLTSADMAGLVDRDKAVAFFVNLIWAGLSAGYSGFVDIHEHLASQFSEDADNEWLKTTAQLVLQACQDLGAEIQKSGRPFGFSDLYSKLDSVEIVQWSNTRDISHTQYVGFRIALMECSIRLLELNNLKNPTLRSGLTEVELAADSNHWIDELFVEKYVQYSIAVFDESAAKFVVARIIDTLNAAVTQFDERSSLYTNLVIFADMHGLNDLKDTLIARANNCLLGYGYRKDFWIWEVVQAVEFLNSSGNIDVRNYVQRLAPCVGAVNDYTDRDEVPGITDKFSKLVRTAWPEKLAKRYSQFVRDDKWHDADKIFQDVLEGEVASNPYATALANTAIDDVGARALASRVDYRTSEMDAIRDTVDRYTFPRTDEKDTTSPSPNSDDEGGFKFDPAEYPANKIADVIMLISKSLGRNDKRFFSEWISHWEDQGKAAEILETAKAVLPSINRYRVSFFILDELFELSLRHLSQKKAFEWAILVHQLGAAWSSLWYISDSDAYPFLEKVASKFKGRALEYVQKASIKQRDMLREHFPGPAIGTDKLVFFLTKARELELAVNCTEEMISILEDELSEQPLQQEQWLQ